MVEIRLLVGLASVCSVHVATCYHTVFFARPVSSAVAFGGPPRLGNVEDVRCTEAVCGTLCGSTVGQVTVNYCQESTLSILMVSYNRVLH